MLLLVTLQGSAGAVGMEGEPRMVEGELLVAVESRICSWNLFAVTLILSVQQQQTLSYQSSSINKESGVSLAK